MWGMGTTLSPVGCYCARCEVFGAKGKPCWSCGSTDLEVRHAPISGFHYDPDSDMATVGSTAGPITVDP